MSRKKRKTERQKRIEIGKAIAHLEEVFKYPQEALLGFLEISLGEYMSIKWGKKDCSVVLLTKLANLYDVPLTYFIDEKIRKKIQLKPYKLCGFKQEDEDG